ncbi:MAG: DUF3298 and DUF4163 domain-containing protein [Sporolactobacillus sp.]|jgi:hypothetical protein|nr:DUF3298 and DUF4163 domain-containing protein [Sporolactobacillus sp.]
MSLCGKIGLAAVVLLSALSASTPAVYGAEPAPVRLTVKTLSEGILYPVIESGRVSPDVRETIDRTFRHHARRIAKLDRVYKKQYQQDQLISAAGPYYAATRPIVRYNRDSRLSVSFVDESYTGGAHGSHLETVYNFDTRTGRRIRLGEVIRNVAARKKVDNYVKRRMSELRSQGRYDFFIGAFRGIDSRNGMFYFQDRGIVLVFQEYEVAPYANGIIHLNVPRDVFCPKKNMRNLTKLSFS